MGRKSLINRRAAKAADSMWRRKGMFTRLKDYQIQPALTEQPEHSETPQSNKCTNYIEEKDNPYPLCDNPECPEKEVCCLSAHMPGLYDESIYRLDIPDSADT